MYIRQHLSEFSSLQWSCSWGEWARQLFCSSSLGGFWWWPSLLLGFLVLWFYQLQSYAPSSAGSILGCHMAYSLFLFKGFSFVYLCQCAAWLFFCSYCSVRVLLDLASLCILFPSCDCVIVGSYCMQSESSKWKSNVPQLQTLQQSSITWLGIESATEHGEWDGNGCWNHSTIAGRAIR